VILDQRNDLLTLSMAGGFLFKKADLNGRFAVSSLRLKVQV